jgi:hypothetical protein
LERDASEPCTRWRAVSSNTKQHHVPQAYLRYFANGDRLRVFKRRDDGQGVDLFETSTENVANQRYLYSIVDDLGRRDDGLDNELRFVEDRIRTALAPLFEDRDLTDLEFDNLLTLAAVQEARKPGWIEGGAAAIDRLLSHMRSMYMAQYPEMTEQQIDDILSKNLGDSGLTGSAALDPRIWRCARSAGVTLCSPRISSTLLTRVLLPALRTTS